MGCSAKSGAPAMVISRQNQRRAAWGVGAYAAKKAGGFIGRQIVSRATKSQSSRTSSDVPRAMTFQHDSMVQYKRRKAPRKKVRRAKRSYKAYLKNEAKGLGLISRNTPSSFASGLLTPTSYSNSQAVYSVGLFGGIYGSITWGDLAAIADAEALYLKAGKLFFRTAILETQVRNNHATAVLVADVYTVAARKEGYNEPDADWDDGVFNQASTTGMGSAATAQLGITPFDAPGFCSSWLIRNKTRYRISPGLSVYLQMRDSKDYQFNTERFEYDSGSTSVRTRMFRGLTKGYLVVARSSKCDTATPKMYPVNFDVIATKTYHFAIQKDAEDMIGVQ